MVSEDSDQFVSGFAVVHRLCDFCDLDQTLTGQVSPCIDDLHAPREPLEVIALRCPQRMQMEERDDRLHQVRAAAYEVLTEVLPMVVMALIDEDAPYPEELLELLEACTTSLTLRHNEPVEHLVAGGVALSAPSDEVVARSRFRSILLRLQSRSPSHGTRSAFPADCPLHPSRCHYGKRQLGRHHE